DSRGGQAFLRLAGGVSPRIFGYSCESLPVATTGEPMAEWLFKEEPDHYNFADLERDGETVWDGVTNALARIHLRKVKKGDAIWYYHTGKEKAIVGLAKASCDAFSDPKSDDPKAVAVRVKPTRRLKQPIHLER